jgi:GNAT superfamily N-acetyltransferase
MSAVRFPVGYRIEPLRRDHARSAFCSGQGQVDDWLTTKALQNQDKHLSATKILVDTAGAIAGFYTLATAQVDFADLPPDLLRRLPRRNLPVAVLAWLGIRDADQGRGLGHRLLAQALRDCFDAGQTFPFVAVILDCVDDKRLFLSWSQLQTLVTGG